MYISCMCIQATYINIEIHVSSVVSAQTISEIHPKFLCIWSYFTSFLSIHNFHRSFSDNAFPQLFQTPVTTCLSHYIPDRKPAGRYLWSANSSGSDPNPLPARILDQFCSWKGEPYGCKLETLWFCWTFLVFLNFYKTLHCAWKCPLNHFPFNLWLETADRRSSASLFWRTPQPITSHFEGLSWSLEGWIPSCLCGAWL